MASIVSIVVIFLVAFLLTKLAEALNAPNFVQTVIWVVATLVMLLTVLPLR